MECYALQATELAAILCAHAQCLLILLPHPGSIKAMTSHMYIVLTFKQAIRQGVTFERFLARLLYRQANLNFVYNNSVAGAAVVTSVSNGVN